MDRRHPSHPQRGAGPGGGKGNIPQTSLLVFRQKPSANSRKTKNLQWRFLPEKADDPRPFAGKTNRGRGKRIYLEGTCGTTDPLEAAKVAVDASQRKCQNLLSQCQLTVPSAGSREPTRLIGLWGALVCQGGTGTSEQSQSLVSDKRNLWNRTTGVGVQPWATIKSIQAITSNDFWEFFRLVRENCEAKGNAGEETRRQFKTLIRNLFKRRRQISPLCPALSPL